MKIKNFSLVLAASLSVTALSGCGIYKKYDVKDFVSLLVY